MSSPVEWLGKQTCPSKAERHRTTCKKVQDQHCHNFRHVVLTTIIPQASNCYFCPIFMCLLWKNGLRFLLLGTKPFTSPSGLLLGKQTCSSRTEAHPKTCQELQNQQRHHFRDNVLTTLIPGASICHFCPIFICFLRKYRLRSIPLGTKPWCGPPSELLGKQTCSSKAQKHRTKW